LRQEVTITITRGRGKKFPFRAKTKAEQADINAQASVILSRVDNMIFDIARNVLPKDVDDDAVLEVVQRCRIWLWQKSLPKFNAWRGVKVSTFLHKCATNFIRQEKRAMTRRRHITQTLDAAFLDSLDARQEEDRIHDRQIEALSLDIMANPSEYMTPSQVTVFLAVVNNPEQMMKVLAQSLNYRRASSLSMIKRRIRERLASIDIEEFAYKSQPDVDVP
jgi:hypothetical protein